MPDERITQDGAVPIGAAPGQATPQAISKEVIQEEIDWEQYRAFQRPAVIRQAIVHCAPRPLGQPLERFLLPTPQPVPSDWLHDSVSIIERDKSPEVQAAAGQEPATGIYRRHLVVLLGGTQGIDRDLDGLRIHGLHIRLPLGLSPDLLDADSTVVLIHRRALDGEKPGIIAHLPIERISRSGLTPAPSAQ